MYKKFDIRNHIDERGSLSVVEHGKEVDFLAARVYWLTANGGFSRGAHAHMSGKQALICVQGEVKIRLNNGYKEETILLEKNKDGLLISGCVWREMTDFSEDAILLVLNDKAYDSDRVIRNWEQYLEHINE
nr:FdtA/QdtA family cupin domain-containing protein [Vibrio sp. Y51_MX_L26]